MLALSMSSIPNSPTLHLPTDSNTPNEQPSFSIRNISSAPNLSSINGREHVLCNNNSNTKSVPYVMARNRTTKPGSIILSNSGGKRSHHSYKEPNLYLLYCFERDEGGDGGFQQPFVGLITLPASHGTTTTPNTFLSLPIMGNAPTQPTPETPDATSKPGPNHISNPILAHSSCLNSDIPRANTRSSSGTTPFKLFDSSSQAGGIPTNSSAHIYISGASGTTSISASTNTKWDSIKHRTDPKSR